MKKFFAIFAILLFLCSNIAAASLWDLIKGKTNKITGMATEGDGDEVMEKPQEVAPPPEVKPVEEPRPVEEKPPMDNQMPPPDNKPPEQPRCMLQCTGRCEWLDSQSCSCKVDQECLSKDQGKMDCASIDCGPGNYCKDGRCIRDEGGKEPPKQEGCYVGDRQVPCPNEQFKDDFNDFEKEREKSKMKDERAMREQEKQMWQDDMGGQDFGGDNLQDRIEQRRYEIEDRMWNFEDMLYRIEDLESMGVKGMEDAKNTVKDFLSYSEGIKNEINSVRTEEDFRPMDRKMQEFQRKARDVERLWREMDKKEREFRMLEEVERMLYDVEFFLSDVEYEIGDLREMGADTSEIDEVLATVKSAVESLKEMKESGSVDQAKFREATREIRNWDRKVRPVMEELRFGFEARRILEEIAYHMEDASYALDEFKMEGIDVNEAEMVMEEIESTVQEAKALIKEGKPKDAMMQLRKMQSVGMRMERLFREYEKQMGRGGRQGRIKDVLAEAYERIPMAEEAIEDFKREGIDTSEAEKLLNNLKGIVYKAKESYKDGDEEDAMDMMREGFRLANKLERLFKDYGKKSYGIGDLSTTQEIEFDEQGEMKTSGGDKISALKETINKIKSQIKNILSTVDKTIPAAEERIEEFKAAGLDTAKAEELITQIKAIVEDARAKYESEDYMGALDSIGKAYPLGDRLESEFSKFGGKKSESTVKLEVEGVLKEALSKIPRVKSAIEKFEKEGIDIEKAKRLVEKIEGIVESAMGSYEKGNLKEAMSKLERAFPLGEELEILFDTYNKQRTDEEGIKTQLDDMFEDVNSNLPTVEATLDKLSSSGVDIGEGREFFTKVKTVIDSSKAYYDEGKYKEALQVIKEAEGIEAKLGHKIEEYFHVLEVGKVEEKYVEKEKKAGVLDKVKEFVTADDEFDDYDAEFEKYAEELGDEFKMEVIDEKQWEEKEKVNEMRPGQNRGGFEEEQPRNERDMYDDDSWGFEEEGYDTEMDSGRMNSMGPVKREQMAERRVAEQPGFREEHDNRVVENVVKTGSSGRGRGMVENRVVENSGERW